MGAQVTIREALAIVMPDVSAGKTAVLGVACPACDLRAQLSVTSASAGGIDIHIDHETPGCDFARAGGLRTWVAGLFKPAMAS